jgi:hypothetical protein
MRILRISNNGTSSGMLKNYECALGIPESEEERVSDEELGEVGLVAEPVELQLPVRQVVRVQDHVAGEEPGHVLQAQCCGTGTVTFCRCGTVTFCRSGTVTFSSSGPVNFCRSRTVNVI